MYKISKIGVYALGAISLLLWIGLVSFVDSSKDNAPMNLMFIVSYVLLVIAIVAAVVSGAKNIASSPAALKKTLIYTGVFAVIAIVSYVLALGETDTTERLVSTGLIAFYILTVIAAGLLVFTGVKNALTK